MTTWLQCHIFTGIVGPYLVLLHSAGRFHGLAGILSLLTVLIVASGFVGRYIYTAVPRNLDGVEVAVRDLEILIAGADRKLAEWGLAPEDKKTLQRMQLSPQASWKLVLARPWLCWRQRRAFRELLPRLSPAARSHATTLQELVEERYRLELQINSLATTRKLLALWHLIHLPLGGVLFMLAFLHIGGALYYATFLR